MRAPNVVVNTPKLFSDMASTLKGFWNANEKQKLQRGNSAMLLRSLLFLWMMMSLQLFVVMNKASAQIVEPLCLPNSLAISYGLNVDQEIVTEGVHYKRVKCVFSAKSGYNPVGLAGNSVLEARCPENTLIVSPGYSQSRSPNPVAAIEVFPVEYSDGKMASVVVIFGPSQSAGWKFSVYSLCKK